MARIERGEPSVVENVIPVTMDERAQAANVDVRTGLTASFASALVNIFKMNTVKPFSALIREVAAKCSKYVPDTEL